MPRPRTLRVISERPAMPPRPDDIAAVAPVATQIAPAPGQDVLAELRRLAAERDEARADAAAAVARGQEISEAAQRHVVEANTRAAAVTEQAGKVEAAAKAETDTVRAQLAKAIEGQKQSGAVATAIVLGVFRQILESIGQSLVWLPALGALLGGFMLFQRGLAAPSPMTLVALALYGAVVVAPAVLLTLRK